MPKLKVQLNNGQIVEADNVRVFVEGLTGREDRPVQLHTNFTGEGIVHDVVDDETGEVVDTDWAEYSDVVYCTEKKDFC